MGILTMLKEGGSLVIDTIGNLPINEDLDLLPNAGGSLSTTFRIIMDSFFITSSNSSQAYAIVMGD
jgi:hypothetical protein